MYWQGIISIVTLLNVCANLNKGVCILCNASTLLGASGDIHSLYFCVEGFPGEEAVDWPMTCFHASSELTEVFTFLNGWKKSYFCDAWNSHGIQMSVRFSSVIQSCLTLCDPMDCSTPVLPVHHQLLEFTQTHVHWVGGAIQPSHPLLSPSPPAFNFPSIWIFSNESLLHIRWPKYWSLSFSLSPSNDVSVPI